MKKILQISKKIIIGALLLYSYNLVAASFNLIIPINIFTILIVSFLDFPGLALLIITLITFY